MSSMKSYYLLCIDSELRPRRVHANGVSRNGPTLLITIWLVCLYWIKCLLSFKNSNIIICRFYFFLYRTREILNELISKQRCNLESKKILKLKYFTEYWILVMCNVVRAHYFLIYGKSVEVLRLYNTCCNIMHLFTVNNLCVYPCKISTYKIDINRVSPNRKTILKGKFTKEGAPTHIYWILVRTPFNTPFFVISSFYSRYKWDMWNYM